MYCKTYNFFRVLSAFFALLTITVIVSAAQYEYPDLAGEANFINFEDFAALAENWQETGGDLAGDFDDSGVVDLDDLAYLSYYWLTGHWECEKIDIDYSGRIDFDDFVKFADCWLSVSGGMKWDARCDFDDSDLVDIYDLKAFCDCWLKGATPLDIWGRFRAALAVGDINAAVSYFADAVADEYAVILEELSPVLPTMVDGMGELVLTSYDDNIAQYEMLHDEGGGVIAGFPVYFSRDDEGRWKIYCF